MIEKIGPVRNPLTIIAIFAAIAEINGTIVLPRIDSSNQIFFIWFLMVFPLLLIVLFFLTLNFNHKVLYAPSDYKNEDNFLESFPRASFAEKVRKIKAEIAEDEPELASTNRSEETMTVSGSVQFQQTASDGLDISYQNLVRRSKQASYMLAEDLVFLKLANEFSSGIQRGVKLDGRNILDGIVYDKGVTTVVEVKYLRDTNISSNDSFRKIFTRIQNAVRFLPKEQSSNFRVLVVIVCEDVDAVKDKLLPKLKAIDIDFYFPIEYRFFGLVELEREFQVGA